MSIDKIKAGVSKLDVNNDLHWDKDGKPALGMTKAYAGVKTLTAAQLEEAMPGYTRDTARQALEGNKTSGTNGAEPEGAVQEVHGNDATDGNAGEPGATNVVSPPPLPPGAPVPPVAPAQPDGTKVTAPPIPHQPTVQVAESTEKKANDPAEIRHNEQQSFGSQTVLGEGSTDLGKSDERRELEERLAQIDAELTDLQRIRNETAVLLDAVIEKEAPFAESFGDANRQYLESQKRQLQARGEQMAALKAQGFDRKLFEKSLPSPAPIDRALKNRPRQG